MKCSPQNAASNTRKWERASIGSGRALYDATAVAAILRLPRRGRVLSRASTCLFLPFWGRPAFQRPSAGTKKGPVSRAFSSGRTWDRTSDLPRVKQSQAFLQPRSAAAEPVGCGNAVIPCQDTISVDRVRFSHPGFAPHTWVRKGAGGEAAFAPFPLTNVDWSQACSALSLAASPARSRGG
jgi:hypothetical protein